MSSILGEWVINNDTSNYVDADMDYYEDGHSPTKIPESKKPLRETTEEQDPDETPSFVLEPADVSRFCVPHGPIRRLCAANNTVLMLFNNGLVYYLSGRGDEGFKIPEAAEDNVHGMFLDPTGTHGIVSLRGGDNMYVHSEQPKARKLDKLKGIMIESIAWDKFDGTKVSTGTILIGNNIGQVFEAKIEARDGLKYCKQVYDLGVTSGDVRPISGLEYEKVFVGDSPTEVYVMLTTNTCRMYQFYGRLTGGSFESVFESYKTNLAFVELPGDIPHSTLQFYRRLHTDGEISLAQSFAWLTGAGIYHGSLSITHDAKDIASSDQGMIPYDASIVGKVDKLPVAMCHLAYHLVLLYRQRLVVLVNPPGLYGRNATDNESLADKVVFDYEFSPQQGEAKDMCYDPIRRSIWISLGKSLFRFYVDREGCNLWKLYLARAIDPGQPQEQHFESALYHCGGDKMKRNKVLIAEADYYFSNSTIEGHMLLAAEKYAHCDKSFETVVLSFMDRSEQPALHKFLREKLEVLKATPKTSEHQFATQLSCLSTWIVEIFLDQMNRLEDFAAQHGERQEDVFRYDQKRQEFRTFLQLNSQYLNPPTTYSMISSHGQVRELLFYAKLIGDYERVINHHISRREWSAAIQELYNQQSNPKCEDLFYRFALALIQHNPTATVKLWMEVKFVKPAKLIPALMAYDTTAPKSISEHFENTDAKTGPRTDSKDPNAVTGGPITHRAEAIRYLRYCQKVLKSDEPAVYSYLLQLYAESTDDTDLREFLQDPVAQQYYDLKFALRLCLENKQDRACIDIYNLMGLYEDAVELALKNNHVDLAKRAANGPLDDESLRKRLWLRIVTHVIEADDDVKSAIEILKESDGLLRIEDILPLFPDFVLIDDFSEEICQSLQKYNTEIRELKSEMDRATDNAESLRLEIRALRKRFGYVDADSQCDLCQQPLLSRPFNLFPCHHAVHRDCLIDEIFRNSDTDSKENLRYLLSRVAATDLPESRVVNDMSAVSIDDGEPESGGDLTGVERPLSDSERVRQELQEVIGGECVLCGDLLIDTVDQPFTSSSDRRTEQEWEIGDLLPPGGARQMERRASLFRT